MSWKYEIFERSQSSMRSWKGERGWSSTWNGCCLAEYDRWCQGALHQIKSIRLACKHALCIGWLGWSYWNFIKAQHYQPQEHLLPIRPSSRTVEIDWQSYSVFCQIKYSSKWSSKNALQAWHVRKITSICWVNERCWSLQVVGYVFGISKKIWCCIGSLQESIRFWRNSKTKHHEKRFGYCNVNFKWDGESYCMLSSCMSIGSLE